HATYDFAEQWRHDARLRIGALYQRELAVLVPGDAIAVEAGATIHALCHVERPSVSVVVRAYDEPDQQTIDYWRPGLAIESGVRDPRWSPALRCLRLVQATEPSRVPALVRELLPRLDARGVVEILRAALEGGADVETILALGQDGPHLLRAHATVLTLALEDMLRHTAFERARARRRDHDDRFALASLYLAEDRECLAALAATRWAPAHAERRLLDVVADLADRSDDVLGLTAHEAASLRGCEPAPSLRRHPMLAPLWRG
ncbi:MAG TPA: hypothetical protein VG755_39175, partial [Nannocystaceae bacterium]|nr:hypothetical protein [Nannocystaceae bacterium]